MVVVMVGVMTNGQVKWSVQVKWSNQRLVDRNKSFGLGKPKVLSFFKNKSFVEKIVFRKNKFCKISIAQKGIAQKGIAQKGIA